MGALMEDKPDEVPALPALTQGKLPYCALEAIVIRPQLDRLSRDVNSAHGHLRDQGSAIERLIIWRDESSRRMGLLEQAASEGNRAVGDLKVEVEALGVRFEGRFQHIDTRLDRLGNGVETLITRFDRHADEMKEAALQTTKKHEKSLRAALTVAYSIGALVAILMAMHGAITGVPILESLKAFFQ